MISKIRGMLGSTDGASAVEYALLVVGIAAIIVAVVFVLGSRTQSMYSMTNSCISTQGSTSGC